ncbi:MAG: glycoside hydrolase family 3 C-terminal domain-containing protein [Clostridia bacterium]|nr:glycoside hydrolase family 3 C-terminal domain-containing protein [Clostridia bacterium]
MKYSTTRRLRKTGRILMMTFAFVAAAGFAAGAMLEANAGQVNSYLGTKTTKTAGVGDYSAFPLDDEYTNSDGSTNTDAIVAAHRAMGIQLAEEGTVLLKNKDNALPLSTSSEKVTLMGYRSTASGALYGMTSGSPVASSQNVSFYDGLTEAGFDVNKSVADTYNSVCSSSTYTSANKPGGMGYYVTSTDGLAYTSREPDLNDDILSASGTSMTGYTDVGIVVIGRASSEQSEYFPGTEGASSSEFSQSASGNVLSLSDAERELIKDAKNYCSKVVVVVTTTNAMELSELEEDDDIDAILLAGFPGNYGFIGVANILAGKANPSGRLSDTYASDSSASPAMQNSGLNLYSNYSGATASDGNSYSLATNDYYGGAYVVQAEGIYVGYKYYETRYEDTVLGNGNASSSAGVGAYATDTSKWNYTDEVTYSFGYGLSYTTFAQTIDSVSFSGDGSTATVTVTVRNTGSVAGKSVVQVYGQSPYTDYDEQYGVEKASVQLLAYDKTEEIAAGSSVTLEITVDMQNLASYDSEGAGSYIMEQRDDYYFALGCNGVDNSEGAHAAVNNILAAKGKTTADGMDVNGSSSAAYQFSWSKAENTFATSKAGVEVSNQLETADLNYYIKDTVTYLSRSDWKATWPKTYSGITATTEMVDYLTNSYYDIQTDDDVSGITFGATYSDSEDANFPDMFVSDGTGATVTDIDDERWDVIVSKVSLEDAISYTASGNRTFEELSSIQFLSANSYTENGSVGIQKTLSQQSDENSPYYVSSSDENAGYYTNTFGSPTLMACTWNQDLMYDMGVLWGNDGIVENMPMVWAPSINIHRTAYNGRNGEYYSEDGILSGYSALRLGQGALSKGLIAATKHFAFNTQETSRLGLSSFMNEQSARENELRGFQVALEGDDYNGDGNTTAVIGIMTSYNRVGVTYSGGHTGLMQGILRGEWNFDGYATSDLPRNKSTYMPYIESMVAGTTNFDAVISSDGTTIWGSSPSAIASSISGDATVLSSIQQNLKYSLWAFSQSNLANWLTNDTRTVDALNWWRLTYYTAEIGGCAVVVCGLALYVTAEVSDAVVKRRERKIK